MDTTLKLPKYVHNANRIIETLALLPNKSWTKPQRDLADQLDISLPEFSALIKTLIDAGRLRRGAPLAGVRGRTYIIELVDDTLLTSPVRRELAAQTNDRMEPGEAIDAPLNLQTLTVDQIGYAVMRMMKQVWEERERNSESRSQQVSRLRDMREQMDSERQARIRLADERATLEAKLAEAEEEMSRLRGEINKLLIRVNERRRSSPGTVKVADMLDSTELAMLDSLMRGRPGHYRESDSEVGA